MASPSHLKRLRGGVPTWNSWRQRNRDVVPDLTRADLNGANLRRANLRGANLSEGELIKASLSGADLSGANLVGANLSGADLVGANLSNAFLTAILVRAELHRANLYRTNLIGADLRGANLTEADLEGTILVNANLSEADLSKAFLLDTDLSGAYLFGANLCRASLVRTTLNGANIRGCHIYGLSVWDVQLKGSSQSDLIITPPGFGIITVDGLQVAQFIYLLLNNQNIRHVIDTITSKVVLILGRFTPDRKVILDAIREELRNRDYLPVLFDFEKPSNRDITETVSTLAHMARFVIADITDARSIPQELMAIVPTLPSVPVQPLLLASQREYGMFEHFKRFPWVLEPYLYEDQDGLLAVLESHVIGPAEKKASQTYLKF
jgi:uncharacterized protein YjbI with pentapeptide repeats